MGHWLMRVAAPFAMLVGVLLSSGCGDPAVWDRYRAERDLWKATRLLDRIERDPRGERAPYGRAIAAFQRIVRTFPPARWASVSTDVGREIGWVSGTAANGLARLERLRGRDREAARAYGQVLSEYRAILPVALEAARGKAESYEAAGERRVAAEVWIELAREFPPVEPERGTALRAVLEAPHHAARLLGEDGDSAAADRTWREAVVRYARVQATWAGTRAAPEVWLAWAAGHQALGEVDPGLAALRSALREPSLGAAKAQVMIDLAERSLASGRPDSALVYATWAEHDLADTGRGQAMLIGATAWEAVDRPDSALAAYQRFLEAFPQNTDSLALVRFRRGDLLERIGRWEQARSEFRTLAAAYPSHELGFAALVRIVRHHAEQGELELARLEGRRALETVEQVIDTYQDAEVQVAARNAHAELLLLLGQPRRAVDTLVEGWRRYPETPGAAEGAVKAAELAATRLLDRDLATALNRELATRSKNADVRRRAQAALDRQIRPGP